MRNPYKKFQNSSVHGSKVMLCVKKRDERMDWRKDGRTNAPEAICPSNFEPLQLLRSWRHNKSIIINNVYQKHHLLN